MLIFYSLFLLFPSVFIKAGLIAPAPLLIIFFLSLIIPAAVYAYRAPFFGDGFLKAIISPPYSSDDLKAALELESNRSFPKKELHSSAGENSITAFLSDSFNEKIFNHIKPEKKIFKDILSDGKRGAVCILIVIISAVLSYAKKELAVDVYAALGAGLPAELIALDAPLRFEKLEAVVIPPAYLESGPSAAVTDLTIKNKIKVMQGSSVLIKGSLGSIKSGNLILSTGKGVEYFTASVNENRFFEATFLAPLKGAFALEFIFSEAVQGKASGKSKVFMIEAMPDQPPAIKIFSPPVNHNVLFGNPVEINFAASDDYGILEISLYHRNPEESREYYKELVARFPKEPKTSYSTSYVWNPVLREGEKIDELVYSPGTKLVEYYLEVRDINTFSAGHGGSARSEIRYVHFTDALTSFQEGINLIQELISDGKRLLLSPGDRVMANAYIKKLNNAAKVFSKELGEIMPQSTLVQKTNEMIAALYLDNPAKIKESLKDYIAYLERFLVFVNLLQETENAASIDKELSGIDEMNRDMKSSLKRLAPIGELLEKEFKKDIEEIKSLIEKGDHKRAQEKLSQLLKKMRDRIAEEIAKSMAASKKIADEIKGKLEKISKQAKDLLKDQELNKAMTDKGKIKSASVKQEEVNKGLSNLNTQTEKLSSEYPFIMDSLNSYAGAAKLYGDRALQSLRKSEQLKSLQHQKQVIQYLKSFMESSSRQMKLMEELAKGNFESLMSRGFASRFVLIPKEAVYTIPIDYKNKIIEMSKDRSKNTMEKEAFWKDILE